VKADVTSCVACHSSHGDVKGPHADYSIATNKCAMCHDVHMSADETTAGAGGFALLPTVTISDSCNTCHDGTGGSGVYGAIAARGLTPGGGHAIDTTSVVPGGDPATGGDSSTRFAGTSGLLSCADCHSPHDSNTVQPFVGDRLRTEDQTAPIASDRLLRRQPTGAPYAVDDYGAEWCGACHRGSLLNTGTVHNHPVETSATPGAYTYGSVPSLVSTSSMETTLAPLGGSNLGYVMPEPRTALQKDHAPICQQCHEDSRAVGQPGAGTAFRVTLPDGRDADDNPRFQAFPHETVNPKMLVESGDDLCTNCHAPAKLP
jgi:hypothetical protein